MERIRAYKELLDQGAITQEDFDAKKAEILGIETVGQKMDRLTKEREAAEAKLEQKIRTRSMLRKYGAPALALLFVVIVLAGFGIGKVAAFSTVDRYLDVLGETPYRNADDVEKAVGGTSSVSIAGYEGAVDYWFISGDGRPGTVDDMTWKSRERLTERDYKKLVGFMEDYMGKAGRQSASDPYFISWDANNKRGLKAYCSMDDDGFVKLWWRLDS